MCDCIATVFQVLLYVTAAALPAVGLIRVYRKARADYIEFAKAPEPSGDDPAAVGLAQADVLLKNWKAAMVRGPVVALTDALLIGIGLLAGTIASIWSLFT